MCIAIKTIALFQFSITKFHLFYHLLLTINPLSYITITLKNRPILEVIQSPSHNLMLFLVLFNAN